MREVKFRMVWGIGLDCQRLTATSSARGYACGVKIAQSFGHGKEKGKYRTTFKTKFALKAMWQTEKRKTPTIADEGFNSLPVVIANSGKA